ncbi:hypothetical protein [Castellaniella denitrificans]|jgi:crossover junction endodeoxyribonuclease RusA|uniref:Uncharacterized protein n=1 Tax=Castellaniella denitrificans TaxID=56119 RepID=A0ABT4M6Y3_9BURK|nr:hypothetical protein [Castellaniella denitrificans]MCZ4331083.1 hypothetical protein [Castellaniella denitrificans]
MTLEDLAFPPTATDQLAALKRAERFNTGAIRKMQALDHITIVLPWPDSRLMPNRKNGRHWAGTQAAKARARMDGAMSAKQAVGRNTVCLPEQIPVKITFAAPDRIRRDLDNLHAAMKASLDGIAKALGVDDSRFVPVTLDRVLDAKKEGFVMIEIGGAC